MYDELKEQIAAAPVYRVRHVDGQEFWTLLDPNGIGTDKPLMGDGVPEETTLEELTLGELVEKAQADSMGFVSGIDINPLELLTELTT